MSVINTNVSSLKSQNSLMLNESRLSSAMERLSTGVRINSAKDDAAGLAISTRMTSEIRGLTAAVRNANDGISVAQTAEGSLGEITNILQRLRELSVQSANSSNNATDRSFLNTESSQLIEEAQRIATQTNFNGVKLLDGTFTSQNFQVGANAGEVVVFNSIADSKATALGLNSLTTAGSVMNTTLAAASSQVASTIANETDLTITTAGGGTTGVITWTGGGTFGADGIAAAINTAANNVGVVAVASNSTTLSGLNEAGTVSMTLNGQSISAVVTTTNDLTTLASAINGSTSATKVTASFANPADKSSITLTTSDGSNIRIVSFANSGANAAGSAQFGTQTLVENGNHSSTKIGTVALTSSKGRISVAGANTTEFATATAASTFSSVYSMDLSTQSGASAALGVLDSALTQVNNTRAALGGLMNRFAASVSNQGTAITNLSASRSRILDTDYAVETTNLAKAQIIQQAATAMLAQANQSSQSVLALLK